VPLQIHHAEARGILSATSGFIAEAGFTDSLAPARNCTFGCTYCYVPTMRIYGGLKSAAQHTTWAPMREAFSIRPDVTSAEFLYYP